MKLRSISILLGQTIVLTRRCLFLFVALVPLILGQNCSKVGFQDSPERLLTQWSLANMQIEDGAQYTNKRILKVTFNSIPEGFDQMRLGLEKDLSGLQWKTVEQSTQFDLANDWAGDGSKDDLKTIYVEMRSSTRDLRRPLAASIGLDTVAPEITLKGLLSNGVQGPSFKLGQAVPLQWNAEDKSKFPNGYTSGLSRSSALKVGYTLAADCSTGVSEVLPWSSFISGLREFKWPVASSLDAFYVCVYAQDEAGNISTALSQPLVSFWRVLAVDNSQGNGGSVRAGNVRFANPTGVVADSAANLYILDTAFRNIRVVDTKQNISLHAGNGSTQCPVEDGIATENGLGTPNQIALDSLGRIVFSSCSDLWRLDADVNGVNRTHSLKFPGFGNAYAMKFDKFGNLYASYMKKFAYNDPMSGAYLFRVPAEEIGTKKFDFDTLKAGYVVVGNGIIPNSPNALTSPYTPPADVILSNSDPADFDHSIGRVTSIALSPDGRIFLGTTMASTGQALGNNTVRELKPLGYGKYRQTILESGYNLDDIEFVVAGPEDEYLIMNGSTVRRFVFKSSNGPTGLIKNLTGTALNGENAFKSRKTSSAMIYDPITHLPTSLIFSQTFNSKILVFNPSFQPLEKWGRDVRDTSALTTQTVLNLPSGITVDSKGNTYIVDTLNSMLKVVGADGLIRNFGGGMGPDKILNEAPLTDLTFNGDYMAYGHHAYHLSHLENGSDKALFFSSLNTKTPVYKIDLVRQTVTTLGEGKDKICSDPTTWEPYGMVSRIENGIMTVYVLRKWLYYTDLDKNCLGTGIKGVSGVITRIQGSNETVIAGQNIFKTDQSAAYITEDSMPADIPLYRAGGLELDSTGYLYFTELSANSSLHAINLNDLSKKLITIPMPRYTFQKLSIFEEGTVRHVFATRTGDVSYFKFDTTNLNQSVTVDKICIPGTFISQIGGMAKTIDGRLLMTDLQNQRVIEYLIKKDGKVTVNICK